MVTLRVARIVARRDDAKSSSLLAVRPCQPPATSAIALVRLQHQIRSKP